MTLVYSVASGAWNANAATVWSSGTPPQAADTVEVRDGHTIVLDGEINAISTCTIKSGGQLTAAFAMVTSAFADIVINAGGKLYASRAVSSYLRVAGTITANGTNSLDYGTAADPISNNAVGAIIEFVCTSDRQLDRGIVTGITNAITFYGATRVWQTTLAQVAAIGDNAIVLADDMALRAGTLAQWGRGLADMIVVGHTPVQTSNGLRNDEIDAYLVGGYVAGTKTVTLGDAGEGQSYWPRGGETPTWNTIHQTRREVGTPVYLLSANVGIRGSAYNLRPRYAINNNTAYDVTLVNCQALWCDTALRYCAGGSTVSMVMGGCATGITGAVRAAITLRFHGGVYPFTSSYGCTLAGILTGADSAVHSCCGCLITATIMACTTGYYMGIHNTQTGDVLACVYGASGSEANLTIYNASGCNTALRRVVGARVLGVLSANNNDINSSTGVAYGATLAGPTEYASDIAADAQGYFESINHNGIVNAYKAWCGMSAARVVTSQVAVLPPGYALAYQHALTSAIYPTFRQVALRVQANEQVAITAQLRKDALMTYLPRVQVIDQNADPLWGNGDAALAEQAMTDSVDTWENIELTWQNTGATAKDVYIRITGMNATGNFYEVATWEVINMTVASDIAAIKAKTDLIPSDPAETSDITASQAALEDAIAAIPTVTPPTVEEIRNEIDSNSTQLEAIRDGIDGNSAQLEAIQEDTGVTLPAQIAALNNLSAADVWAAPSRTLTQTAAAASAAMTSAAITITRGATWSVTFTGLTIPTNWTKVIFTIKRPSWQSADDSYAELQIIETNPSAATDGISYINRAAASSTQRAYGELTVNQAGGTVTATVLRTGTTLLEAMTVQAKGYDLKICAATSDTLYQGAAAIEDTPTQTV